MGERIDISADEMAALEDLILVRGTPRAETMYNLAGRGLVWRTGAGWTISHDGWQAIRGRRYGVFHDQGLDATAPRSF